MKFTDKQLMLYVDGDLDKETTKNIKSQLKKSKSLRERVNVFEVANEAMFEHIEETMKMPAELFEQLREIEEQNDTRSKTSVINKQKSLLSKFIDDVFSFQPFPAGFAAAAVLAFGLFTTSQVQEIRNENLAQNFFASSQYSFQYNDAENLEKKQMVIASTKKYDTRSTVLRSQDTKKELADEQIVLKVNDPKMGLVLEMEDTVKGKSCTVPNQGFVAKGAQFDLRFTAMNKGTFGLLYFDSQGKEENIFTAIPLANKEMRSVKGIFSEPVGRSYFQYIFEKDTSTKANAPVDRIVETALLDINILSASNKIINQTKEEIFSKKPRSLFSKEIFIEEGGSRIDFSILGVTDFGKNRLKKIERDTVPTIWKENKKIFSDLTADGYANIILSLTTPNEQGFTFIVDRDSNQKVDAFIKSYKTERSTFYQWLLDENEDGKPDLLANDCDGNWIIDQIFPVKK